MLFDPLNVRFDDLRRIPSGVLVVIYLPDSTPSIHGRYLAYLLLESFFGLDPGGTGGIGGKVGNV